MDDERWARGRLRSWQSPRAPRGLMSRSLSGRITRPGLVGQDTRREETAAMNGDEVVRAQLLTLLQGRGAHMTFDEVVADFPMEHINTRAPGVPYTMWHLLEHLRI